MIIKARMWIGVLVIAGASTAMAGEGPVGSARGEVKEARKEMREARKGGGPEAVASAVANLRAAQDKLRETRAERRRTHAIELRAKWKDVLDRPAAREQMRIHARREARLHRMKALATELGKTKLVQTIDELIAKEQARFDKKMEEIRAQGAKK
jgi:hypothetical protein